MVKGKFVGMEKSGMTYVSFKEGFVWCFENIKNGYGGGRVIVIGFGELVRRWYFLSGVRGDFLEGLE